MSCSLSGAARGPGLLSCAGGQGRSCPRAQLLHRFLHPGAPPASCASPASHSIAWALNCSWKIPRFAPAVVRVAAFTRSGPSTPEAQRGFWGIPRGGPVTCGTWKRHNGARKLLHAPFRPRGARSASKADLVGNICIAPACLGESWGW